MSSDVPSADEASGRRRRFVRNVSWNYGAGLTTIVGLVVLYPWAVALAGAAEYGLWVLAFGATQLLVMADFGMGDGIVRQMGAMVRAGASHVELRRFVGVGMTIFMGLALGLALLYGAVVPFYLRTVDTSGITGDTLAFVVVAGAIALFLAITLRAMNAVLWAQDRQDIERKATVVSMTVRVIGFLVVAWTGTGLVGVVLAEVISAMIPPVVCTAAVLRRFGPPIVPREAFGRHAKPLVRVSSVLFVGSFASLLAFQVPLFVVGSSLGLVAGTAYGALMRVYQSARMVNSWTSTPFIHGLSAAGPQELVRRARLCVSATIAVGSAEAVVVSALAPDIIVAWLGGQFAFAAPALAMLGLAMFADAVSRPSAQIVNLRSRPVIVSTLHVLSLVGTLVAVLAAASTGSLTLVVLAMGAVALVLAPFYLWAAARVVGEVPLPRGGLVYLALVAVAAAGYGVIAAISALLSPWPAVIVVGGIGALVLAAGVLVWRRRSKRPAAPSDAVGADASSAPTGNQPYRADPRVHETATVEPRDTRRRGAAADSEAAEN